MKKGGFTLIELLVVVAIISLLSSVVMVSVEDARNKAKVAQLKQDFIQVRNAAELYKNDTGDYPASIAVLVPQYLSKAPSNPFYVKPTGVIQISSTFIPTVYAAISTPVGGITLPGTTLPGVATTLSTGYDIAKAGDYFCATALDESQRQIGKFFISSPYSVGAKNAGLFTKFKVRSVSCTYRPCAPAQIYNTDTQIFPCLD